MGKGQESELAPSGASPSWSDRSITGAFLLFFLSLGIAASFLLFREGKRWVLLIALAAGALLWVLEYLEVRYLPASTPTSNPLPGYLAPVALITLVTLVACLPALHTYFLVDDFAFVHRFYTLTVSQFLQLLHTDLGRFVWGDVRQEYRPLYSVYYLAGYHLWGLDPWGYHLSGVLLHVANALLVILIVKSLAPGESRRAIFAGLLFAVLPVHAQAISLIVGFVAEGLPDFFYLVAFLCFMRFRARSSATYLVISTVAFGLCLLTKESAVTLPMMLVSFDFFRMVVGEKGVADSGAPEQRKKWLHLILAYVPFAVLLLAYLELRRLVFTSYLREANWGSHVHEAVSSPAGFWLHLRHLLTHFWDLQAFNLREIFPFPALALGFILGLLGVWAVILFGRRSECRRCIAVVVYFGLVWYLICNLPFLIEGRVIYHLYLPAVGLSIATAFLALPPYPEPRKEARYLRFLGMVFLVGISATWLRKENAEYARIGNMSERMAAQLVTALAKVPKESLVVIWPAESYLITSGWGEEILPYAVQTPFAPTDLYSRVRIIEHPEMSCCGVSEWWEKTRPVLGAELARAQDEQMEIYLFAWDVRSNSFQQKTRVLPRGLFRAYVTKSLGGPLESTDSLGDAAANTFVEALAKLVLGSGLACLPPDDNPL